MNEVKPHQDAALPSFTSKPRLAVSTTLSEATAESERRPARLLEQGIAERSETQ